MPSCSRNSESGAAGKTEELGLIELVFGDGLGEVKPYWPELGSPNDRASGGGADQRRIASNSDTVALRKVQYHIFVGHKCWNANSSRRNAERCQGRKRKYGPTVVSQQRARIKEECSLQT